MTYVKSYKSMKSQNMDLFTSNWVGSTPHLVPNHSILGLSLWTTSLVTLNNEQMTLDTASRITQIVLHSVFHAQKAIKSENSPNSTLLGTKRIYNSTIRLKRISNQEFFTLCCSGTCPLSQMTEKTHFVNLYGIFLETSRKLAEKLLSKRDEII